MSVAYRLTQVVPENVLVSIYFLSSPDPTKQTNTGNTNATEPTVNTINLKQIQFQQITFHLFEFIVKKKEQQYTGL